MKIGKINLPIGKVQNSTFNLNNHVIATGEMGQLIPIRQIECVPNDKFTIDVEMFSRTAPLVCPTYGSVKFTTRAFFVPSRLCMAHFKEFITQKQVAVDGGYYIPKIPYITNYELTELFTKQSNGLLQQVGSTNAFDIDLRTTTGSVVAQYCFTYKGRHWLKIFNGLGIRWNFLKPSNNTAVNNDNICHYSLLPLFAFLRVYMDYYLPSQFLIGSNIKQFFDGYIDVTTSHELMIERLFQVISELQLSYDDDYFTMAWRYPLSLLDNNNVNFNTIAQESSSLVLYNSDGSSNPDSNTISAYSGRLSSTGVDDSAENGPTNWALQMARSLANYVIRNNYAGSRAVEQILARFGVKVPDFEFQRSVHFGTSETSLQIMDVTNTAESEYAKLGSYGAKAVGFDNGRKMHIECKEHGFIILLATIMPETSMGWQGFDRNTQHLSVFDFYTPEFDGKFMQPIFSGELLSDYKGQYHAGETEDYQDYVDNNTLPRNVFGFVPTYTEYKVAKDNVIGDFNVPTLKQGLDCYHLFRDYYPNSPTLAQNPDLIYFNSEQYNRIFNVTDKSVDHFYMIYRIKVKANRPMLSISESIPFDDNDIEHRNRVSVRPNGSNFNK